MARLLLAGIMLALFGCASGSNNPYTETGAICDNAGLESQLVRFHDRSNRIRGALGIGLPKGGGAVGGERDRTDIQRVYQLRERLNNFEAEVDVQYRNVTSSCKAFSRCMEQNRYVESSCEATLNRWTVAEESFSKLAIELRRIAADVEKHCKDCGPKKPAPPVLNPKDPCECDDTFGGVFANCCDRRRY